jgi:hypothetical protein
VDALETMVRVVQVPQKIVHSPQVKIGRGKKVGLLLFKVREAIKVGQCLAE